MADYGAWCSADERHADANDSGYRVRKREFEAT